jgi:hypothetical protein
LPWGMKVATYLGLSAKDVPDIATISEPLNRSLTSS